MALDKLLTFMVHPAISSINLTTALGSLATIARQRPMFMSKVVQAYETLHGECLDRNSQQTFGFRVFKSIISTTVISGL